MRKHRLVILVAFAVLLIASAETSAEDRAVEPRPRESDRQRIQGTWEIISLHFDGKEIERAREVFYVFSSGNLRVVSQQDEKGNLKTFHSYSLESKQNSKNIEWRTTQQLKTWQPSHPDGAGVLDPHIAEIKSHRKGIYAFDGDQLKLCFGNTAFWNADAERAKDFSTKPGDRQTLIVLRRLSQVVYSDDFDGPVGGE